MSPRTDCPLGWKEHSDGLNFFSYRLSMIVLCTSIRNKVLIEALVILGVRTCPKTQLAEGPAQYRTLT
jgi:hypothetical protein